VEGRLDRVDVFGSLAKFGDGNRRQDVVVDPATGKVSLDGNADRGPGFFELNLDNGDDFPITKAVRIPYRYKVEGNDDTWIYSNIIVLFNGTGHTNR
jgi:hypothetical protein